MIFFRPFFFFFLLLERSLSLASSESLLFAAAEETRLPLLEFVDLRWRRKRRIGARVGRPSTRWHRPEHSVQFIRIGSRR